MSETIIRNTSFKGFTQVFRGFTRVFRGFTQVFGGLAQVLGEFFVDVWRIFTSSSKRCMDSAPCLLALTMVGNSELFSSTNVSPNTHTTAMPSSAYSLLLWVQAGGSFYLTDHAMVPVEGVDICLLLWLQASGGLTEPIMKRRRP
jgi:hypothetical protein